ncbi:hypothetical protein IFO70_14545 [Phormidium tenue FACHB-886]|nr:hypothetical protein [Phormidium tenue FACHB-886]
MDLLMLVINAVIIFGAVVAAIVALFSAPWQLLLMILLGGLWATRWLMQENQRRSLADEMPPLDLPQFANNPQLSSKR